MNIRPLVMGLGGAALLAAAVGIAVSIPAGAADPPGNNGFVKVDDEPVEGIPNNKPHVALTFHVDFYNYDEGDLFATVGFALHPPTRGDAYTLDVDGETHVFIGEDPAGGGNDLDATQTYTLTITGDPHPIQGHHVKLTVHAEGSQGADVKHKVFWVSGCGSRRRRPRRRRRPPRRRRPADDDPADDDPRRRRPPRRRPSRRRRPPHPTTTTSPPPTPTTPPTTS